MEGSCYWLKIQDILCAMLTYIIFVKLEIASEIFRLFERNVDFYQFLQHFEVVCSINCLLVRHKMGINHILFIKKCDEHAFHSRFLSTNFCGRTSTFSDPLSIFLLPFGITLKDPRFIKCHYIIEPSFILL